MVNATLPIQYGDSGELQQIGGYTFTYDAENRQKTSTLINATTTYFYDGEGRRVKKVASDRARRYTCITPWGNWRRSTRSNPPARGCTTYLTADHLGSTRVATSASGDELARRDYLPFGEEIPSGIGSRTSLSVRDMGATQKFTGKERDAECRPRLLRG